LPPGTKSSENRFKRGLSAEGFVVADGGSRSRDFGVTDQQSEG